MSDFDDDFAATVLADMFDVFGTSATLARGSSSATVTVKRRTSETRTSGETVRMHANVVQLEVLASEYTFGSGTLEPQIGDTITVSGVRFEVGMFGELDRPWEWASEARDIYIIDTVEVAT